MNTSKHCLEIFQCFPYLLLDLNSPILIIITMRCVNPQYISIGELFVGGGGAFGK